MEVASREGRGTFVNRERMNPLMLRYPKPTDPDYTGKCLVSLIPKQTNFYFYFYFLYFLS